MAKAVEVQTNGTQNGGRGGGFHGNHNLMANMQNMAIQMQQNMIAHQQKMIQEDPECKDLMDKHMKINQKMFAAMQSGDQGALSDAQMEALELQKHPKYLQLMMPQVHTTKNVTSSGPASANMAKNMTFKVNTSTSIPGQHMNTGTGHKKSSQIPTGIGGSNGFEGGGLESMFSQINTGMNGGPYSGNGGYTNFNGDGHGFGGGQTSYGGFEGNTSFGGGGTDFGSGGAFSSYGNGGFE